MMIRVWTQPSPLGELVLGTSDVGLCSLEWGSSDAARRRLEGIGDVIDEPDPDVVGALHGYFAGDTARLESVPVDWRLVESGFRREVLIALHQLESGRLTTYGALAAQVAKPGAAQAVGQAVGSNPVPIVVPCHRVVSSDGSLGGFSGGLSVKRRLLGLEGFADLPGGWAPADSSTSIQQDQLTLELTSREDRT